MSSLCSQSLPLVGDCSRIEDIEHLVKGEDGSVLDTAPIPTRATPNVSSIPITSKCRGMASAYVNENVMPIRTMRTAKTNLISTIIALAVLPPMRDFLNFEFRARF